MMAIATLYCVASSEAKVQLAPVFGDNMVLQREKPLAVWGNAAPREKVNVRVGKERVSTQADEKGAWRVTVPAQAAAAAIEFEARGKNIVTLKNVAMGEVFLCAGQSNMEWPVSQSDNAAAEIAAAVFPDIRYFAVPKRVRGTAQKTFDVPVSWQVCTPENVPDFSAVSYYFAREMNRELKVPIGLIEASWGGVIAQTFLSERALLKRDDTREWTQKTAAAFAPEALRELDAKMEAWWSTQDKGSRENWAKTELDDAAWSRATLPAKSDAEKLPPFEGVTWLRREITIPQSWRGRDLLLHLGALNDWDTTYFNGQKIGATAMWNQQRVYRVPRELVKSGRAVIAIRLANKGVGGGFVGPRAPRLKVLSDDSQSVELADDWKYRSGATSIDGASAPQDLRVIPDQPSVLFNGMIAPLVSVSLRGVLWYQGESNVGNAAQYRTLFPDLIGDWRAHWQDDFPFYFVQLSTFGATNVAATEDGWANLRDAQTATLSTQKAAMAVTLDIGNGGYHPTNKQEVGRRLALAALAKSFARDVEYSGPLLREIKIEGDKIRVSFSHATGLKTSDGAAPRGFAISGNDGQWFPAEARIEGEEIIVASTLVAAPKAVAYAWKNHPQVNIVNAAGLPAAPFRTSQTP